MSMKSTIECAGQASLVNQTKNCWTENIRFCIIAMLQVNLSYKETSQNNTMHLKNQKM